MRKDKTALGFVALTCCAILVLGACGGGASEQPPPATPSSAPGQYGSPAPSSLEGALSELDSAERDVYGLLGLSPPRSGFAQPPAGGAAPAEAPAAAPPPPPAQPAPADARAESTSDTCATACRALGSMGRATEHLCGIAGESDERCASARARVHTAKERVRARCPACG